MLLHQWVISSPHFEGTQCLHLHGLTGPRRRKGAMFLWNISKEHDAFIFKGWQVREEEKAPCSFETFRRNTMPSSSRVDRSEKKKRRHVPLKCFEGTRCLHLQRLTGPRRRKGVMFLWNVSKEHDAFIFKGWQVREEEKASCSFETFRRHTMPSSSRVDRSEKKKRRHVPLKRQKPIKWCDITSRKKTEPSTTPPWNLKTHKFFHHYHKKR